MKQCLESPTLDHRTFSALIDRFDLTAKLTSVKAFLQESQ